MEDFQLTKDSYSAQAVKRWERKVCQALEEALKPMQEAVRRVQSRVTFPEKSSMVDPWQTSASLGGH